MTRTLLTVCLLLASVFPAAGQGSAGDEQRLKAAFVVRFPQFVEWPPAALADRQAFEICIDGPGAMARALRELTAGELINGRPLLVRDSPSVQNLSSCLVLVLAGPRPDRDLFAHAVALPILTVGDSPTFLSAGGIIQLKMVDRRVRFEIDLPAATRAGLTLSSQLLRLASTVRGGP